MPSRSADARRRAPPDHVGSRFEKGAPAHARAREATERVRLLELGAPSDDAVEAHLGGEELVVGRRGRTAHPAPLCAPRFEQLDEALRPAFGPADRERVPVGPLGRYPCVGDDDRDPPGGERLVESDRGRPATSGTEDEAGAAERRAEPRAPVVERRRALRVEGEAVYELDDRVRVPKASELLSARAA